MTCKVNLSGRHFTPVLNGLACEEVKLITTTSGEETYVELKTYTGKHTLKLKIRITLIFITAIFLAIVLISYKRYKKLSIDQ